MPHRRVISCNSDLLALNAFILSVSRVCSSSGSFGCACVSVPGGACRGSSCCSRCGRAFVCESGALCRVCAEGAHQSVVSSVHNSWKHGHEAGGGTNVLSQSSGFRGGCSFVDTVLAGAALAQYLRGAPEGTLVEAWEGRIFTCSGPITWDVSVAEGCIVTVSAVYLPEKRTGLPAPGPLYRILFVCSRLLYTPSSGVWIFRGALRGSQVMPALASCFDWAVRGTYRTAWAVQPCCRCSYSYGNGPAHDDLLVMDGRCQDEYLHCTELLQGGERSSVPTCAKGSLVSSSTESFLPGLLSVVLLFLLGWGLFFLIVLFTHYLELRRWASCCHFFPAGCGASLVDAVLDRELWG